MTDHVGNGFAELIRARLGEMKQTQGWLAKELGVTPPVLSDILNQKKAFEYDLETISKAPIGTDGDTTTARRPVE